MLENLSKENVYFDSHILSETFISILTRWMYSSLTDDTDNSQLKQYHNWKSTYHQYAKK